MPDERPAVGAFFDAESGFYDAAFDARTPAGHALRTRLAASLRLLGRGPGRVLDAGMGPGRLLDELARNGWSVAGADLSEAMVMRARRRLPAAAELVKARLESLPFPSESFDAVAATGVLEYVDDLDAAVQELARVLRPGGVAVMSTPNPSSLYGLWRRRLVYPLARVVKSRIRGARPAPPPGTRIQAGRLPELLSASGLAIEGVERVGFHVLLSPLDELFPAAALWLSERLERAWPALGSLLATQLVYVARKSLRDRSVS